jgi:hypothetical protein
MAISFQPVGVADTNYGAIVYVCHGSFGRECNAGLSVMSHATNGDFGKLTRSPECCSVAKITAGRRAVHCKSARKSARQVAATQRLQASQCHRMAASMVNCRHRVPGDLRLVPKVSSPKLPNSLSGGLGLVPLTGHLPGQSLAVPVSNGASGEDLTQHACMLTSRAVSALEPCS